MVDAAIVTTVSPPIQVRRRAAGHLPSGVGTMLLRRCRQRARSDAEDDSEGHRDFGEHDRVSCFHGYALDVCACPTEIGVWPAGTIKLPFRKLNSMLTGRVSILIPGQGHQARTICPPQVPLGPASFSPTRRVLARLESN